MDQHQSKFKLSTLSFICLTGAATFLLLLGCLHKDLISRGALEERYVVVYKGDCGAPAQSIAGVQSTTLSEERPLVWYADRMSVEHYIFPGQIGPPDGDTPPADAVLHLFTKCVNEQLEAVCSGWGFAEGTGSVEIEHWHVAQPAPVAVWKPRVEIRAATGATFALNVSTSPPQFVQCRVFHVWGRLPLALRELVPEIHIDDWPRFHSFRNLDPPSSPPPQLFPSGSTVLLMSTFYYHPPDGKYAAVAQAIVHHVRHHLRMGLAGEIVYLQHHYPAQLLKNQELREYVKEGKLQLVVWDSFPQYGGIPDFPYYDQPLQYSHGLLESWGRGLRVLVCDVDEFLVTPEPGGIATILECANGLDQAYIQRFDVMCEGSRCSSTGQGDTELWESPSRDPLKYYTLMDRNASSVSWNKWPKALVVPEKVRHFDVHEGAVLPGGWDGTVSESCAFLLHVLSMFKARTETTANFVVDTSWQWMFEH